MIKAKFWFFRNYWWVFASLASGFIAFVSLSNTEIRLDVSIGLFTLVISTFFFIQRQRIEELRLFNELFKDFNSRFDRLNDDLNKIYEKDLNSSLSKQDCQKLYDYFNLCGEEFFYNKQRHIYPEVWESWVNGMRYYYKNPYIKDIWDEDLKQNSYYGFDKKLLQ